MPRHPPSERPPAGRTFRRLLVRLSSPLVAVEAAFVAIFVVFCVMIALRRTDVWDMRPIEAQALAVGPASEKWMGIYFQDQPVGYSVSSDRPTVDGGHVMQGRSVFRLASFGEIKQVVTAGTALVAPDRTLQRFDFLMSSSPVRLAVQGEVDRASKLIRLEIHQGEQTQHLDLTFVDPPQMSLSLPNAIAGHALSVGQSFDLPYFDPVTLAQSSMKVSVDDVEILPGGEEAYWLKTTFAGMESRMLVTPDGDTIREEGALGMSMVRMTKEEAEKLGSTGSPVDLIGLSAVHVDQPLPDARQQRLLIVDAEGVDPGRVPSFPPWQVVDGVRITRTAPLIQELPAEPLVRGTPPPELAPYLEATATLPVNHPEVVAKADQILAGITDRREAAQRLVAWVFENVEKRPVIGVPNGLEVLRTRVGDCNEHTALYVTLARAGGLPARLMAGIVYSDRIGDEGAFYYHAWPEVALGGDVGWVAVDPTFGQFPADATHVALAEGDLDRQVEIMGFMGRLSLKVVQAR
jgi:hypothetical protein